MYTRKNQTWLKHVDFILLDLLCLQIAFVLAYITRHGWSNPYAQTEYWNLAIIYTLIDFIVLITNRMMRNVLKRGFYREMERTVKHVFLVTVIIALYMFSVQLGDTYSRITIYLVALFYCLISYGVRVLWKRVLLHRKREVTRTAIYIVTTKSRAERIIRRFRKNHITGDTIRGLCILDQDCTGEMIAGVPVEATGETLIRRLCEIWVDEVFVSIPKSYPYPKKLMSSMAEMGIVVHLEMEQLEGDPWQHQVIQEFAGTTVRTISMTMATPMQAALKRTLDIIGGIVGCIITCLLTVILGPIIYIQSPGPIFFSQTRVGKNGRKFKLYKFRSMYPDAEERKAALMAENRIESGLMFKLEYDPRIIGCKKLPDGTIKKGIGNFIRDYSLDEFPQFWNCLKGDISLVGTRPPTVDEWEQYELHHRARLAIKPGITGMWQVSGRSEITDFEEVVRLDTQYINEWSIGLDIRILLQTVATVLKQKGSM